MPTRSVSAPCARHTSSTSSSTSRQHPADAAHQITTTSRTLTHPSSQQSNDAAGSPQSASRRCVITGATRGIGLAMAEALAAQGAEVTLVGRDAERLAAAERSVAEHAKQGGALPPRSILADLATEHGVEWCVSSLLARDLPIDVLINNAGAIFPVRSLTADGIERTFARWA